jgi:hypothetical protein
MDGISDLKNTNSVSRLMIRVSNRSKALLILNSDTQTQIKPDTDPRGPVSLNPGAAMPQADLSIINRPAASIGVPQNHAPQGSDNPAQRAARAVAKLDDGDAGWGFCVLYNLHLANRACGASSSDAAIA